MGIIAGALLITPGADPYTPTALFVPLIVFFEASVLVLDKVFKHDDRTTLRRHAT